MLCLFKSPVSSSALDEAGELMASIGITVPQASWSCIKHGAPFPWHCLPVLLPEVQVQAESRRRMGCHHTPGCGNSIRQQRSTTEIVQMTVMLPFCGSGASLRGWGVLSATYFQETSVALKKKKKGKQSQQIPSPAAAGCQAVLCMTVLAKQRAGALMYPTDTPTASSRSKAEGNCSAFQPVQRVKILQK